ncbi:hypothetical protein T08_2566 [Trichinella sp. T8]|nr:hypothetical protein T08_2566 [Trichinella sp. T8]
MPRTALLRNLTILFPSVLSITMKYFSHLVPTQFIQKPLL